MSKTAHRIYLAILIAIVFTTLIIIIYRGTSYYNTSLEERVYHNDHSTLKPSGFLGHGMGILGSFFMIVGVFSYMIRKRYRFLSRLGILKHWLEFHIFLCTLGPILVLFHTAFKFGGIVAISFWSMVAVFLSGIIGRFIYIQIPRTIEGRELTLTEIRSMKTDIAGIIKDSYNLDEQTYSAILNSVKTKVELYHKNAIVRYFRKYLSDRETISSLKNILNRSNLPKNECKKIISIIKDDISLNRRIERLDTMQNMLKYWHVVHLPFALVMLIIMVVHVGVTIIFGYRWIF